MQRNVEQFDTAVSRIGRSVTDAGRMLSLGATPLVAANILPQAIKEFRGRRPDLQPYDIRRYTPSQRTMHQPFVQSRYSRVGPLAGDDFTSSARSADETNSPILRVTRP